MKRLDLPAAEVEKLHMNPQLNGGLSRRNFVGMVAGAAALGHSFSMNAEELAADKKPLFVATWPFGKPACEDSLKVFEKTGNVLDAVEQGIWHAENDNSSVGLKGIPNAAGVVQLDACIMYGPGHKGGSVAALEGIAHPISVARRVMEKTKHVMLVGQGAKDFAIAEGFPEVKEISERQKKAYENWKSKQEAERKKAAEKGHDTIALLGLAPDGTLAGGCSTSGLAYKMHGRVGDSPILGSGLYVDNEVGAAGATGVGENIMRFCGSFMVVELMRQGFHPQEACVKAIERIARMDPKGAGVQISFVALDKKGRYGAAGSAKGFTYAVVYPGFSKVLTGASISEQAIGVIGGNQPRL